ncbi:SH3 domain-containing protein [Flavobacterium columnare]|uniref:SH3 domain-containing protein n=2 Tax=Flavobacterium columnare TaxID=996 RepID=UPI000D1BC94B|nr:SH3 domain-containing protein [Flavobacterium columnare]PTD14015.1 hypothetical protein C6N29_05945 [Flavobacterium columnare]
MNRLIIFLLLLISHNNYAQNSAKELEKTFISKNEKLFLDNFPDSFNKFKSIFGWNDKLEKPNLLYNNANEYIDYFFTLVSKPKYKIYQNKIIKISINGKWEADAVGYFQTKLHSIIKTNKDFVNLLSSLNEKDISSFWRFYFDSENLDYPNELNTVLEKEMKNKSKMIFGKMKIEKNQDPENISKNRQSKYQIFDKDGYTNLRAEKNSNSKIIDKLQSGEEITVIESIDNWWKIQNKNKKQGYVHKSRIKLKEEDKSVTDNLNFIKNLEKKGFKNILEKKCDLNQDNINDKIIVFSTAFSKKSDVDDYKEFMVCVVINDDLFHNKNIIQKYYRDNVAAGFNDIKIKDNYFTVEQVNGSGSGILQEYTTFKYSKINNKIILHKYSKIETVRSSGDEDEKTYNFSEKNFGRILFEDYNSETISEKCKK